MNYCYFQQTLERARIFLFMSYQCSGISLFFYEKFIFFFCISLWTRRQAFLCRQCKCVSAKNVGGYCKVHRLDTDHIHFLWQWQRQRQKSTTKRKQVSERAKNEIK